MIKKIAVAVFIAFGLFQLIDVNYRSINEGRGLREAFAPVPAPVAISALTSIATSAVGGVSSEPTVAVVNEVDSCLTAGFSLNATFANQVKARLPEYLLKSISPVRDSVAYFSELIGIKNPVVEFRWLNAGVQIHSEIIDVKGVRWRGWSTIDGLSKPATKVNKFLPLTVEIWSGKCLVHSESIIFSAAEDLTRLDAAASYFDYHANALGDVSDAFQYSKEVDKTGLVYRFEERAGSAIYVAIEKQERSESTHDVFSQYVARDEALPLSYDAGGKVKNYSDIIINRKSLAGDTILLEAIKRNSSRTTQSLLAIGANPFIRDKNNRSPLDLALATKNKLLVESLLEYMLTGSSLKYAGWRSFGISEALTTGNFSYLGERNRLGETVLMRAAASGDEFAIIELMGMNAEKGRDASSRYQDPYYFDYAGRQAVDMARDFGYAGATLLLEKAMEKFSPSWAVYHMLMTSDLQGDAPEKCFIKPGQRIRFLATIIDAPLKTAKVVWSVKPSFNIPLRPVKTDEYLVNNTNYQLESYVDPADLGQEPIMELQASLYLNDRLAPNGTIVKNYLFSDGSKCKNENHNEKNSLKKQFAAWLPLNVIRGRAAGFSAENLRSYEKLLEIAIADESPSLIQYLLENGMDPQIKYYDYPLVHSAISHNKLALTQQLLAEGASLIKTDSLLREQKKSLMFDAVYRSDLAMVRFLHQQGLAVTELNDQAPQPLKKALDNCDVSMVVLLLKLGADPNATASLNPSGESKTIADYAQRCSYEPEILRAFQSAQALPNL